MMNNLFDRDRPLIVFSMATLSISYLMLVFSLDAIEKHNLTIYYQAIYWGCLGYSYFLFRDPGIPDQRGPGLFVMAIAWPVLLIIVAGLISRDIWRAFRAR